MLSQRSIISQPGSDDDDNDHNCRLSACTMTELYFVTIILHEGRLHWQVPVSVQSLCCRQDQHKRRGKKSPRKVWPWITAAFVGPPLISGGWWRRLSFVSSRRQQWKAQTGKWWCQWVQGKREQTAGPGRRKCSKPWGWLLSKRRTQLPRTTSTGTERKEENRLCIHAVELEHN